MCGFSVCFAVIDFARGSSDGQRRSHIIEQTRCSQPHQQAGSHSDDATEHSDTAVFCAAVDSIQHIQVPTYTAVGSDLWFI